MVVSAESIPEILQDCAPKLIQNLVIGDLLGRGVDGYVYQSQSGYVIKFSLSSSEAQIAEYLRHHPHPGFPKIEAVWDLSHRCQVIPPFYAIVREEISEVSENNLRILNLLTHLMYLASSKYIIHSEFIQQVERIRNDFIQRINPTPHQRHQFERIRKLALWMRRIGLYGSDFGGSNWGERANGDLVIRDFSQFTFVPSRSGFEVPRLRQNPDSPQEGTPAKKRSLAKKLPFKGLLGGTLKQGPLPPELRKYSPGSWERFSYRLRQVAKRRVELLSRYFPEYQLTEDDLDDLVADAYSDYLVTKSLIHARNYLNTQVDLWLTKGIHLPSSSVQDWRATLLTEALGSINEFFKKSTKKQKRKLLRAHKKYLRDRPWIPDPHQEILEHQYQSQREALTPEAVASPWITLFKAMRGREGLQDIASPEAEDVVNIADLQKILKTAMKKALMPREIEILKIYYGLGKEIPKTLDAISEYFRVTRERIRQIKVRGLRKLQEYFEDQGFNW